MLETLIVLYRSYALREPFLPISNFPAVNVCVCFARHYGSMRTAL